ncbi:ATP-binding cassette domain-containing protein [Synechococcus sp. AH-707-M23]|nr:ATP-binding cassette domain-containing protein [Synechococcus sp. AH-707-M23]
MCRNITNVLLSNTPRNLYDDYREIDLSLRWSESRSRFFTDFPRFILEAIGFILLAIVAFYFSVYNSDPAKSIGFIAALALGLQKILPAIQQIYSGIAKINILNSSTIKINTLLNLPPTTTSQSREQLSFVSLHLHDIAFQYPGAHSKALENINLVLEAGVNIGLIGTSGAGKSTFLNIILGLYKPTSGSMICQTFLNDKSFNTLDIFSSPRNLDSWHATCAYVPQDIQLINGTILDNIAFPFPTASLDSDSLNMALETCCLREFVNSLPNGIHYLIGDNGNSLSGGQRQRLSLARAIVKQPQILVLDEATSSMDNLTESKVINNISRLPFSPSIIMCAHRLSSLAYCSKVYKLSSGSLSSVSL